MLTVKHKAPGVNNSSADFDEEVTVAEGVAELKKKSDAVKADYIKLQEMGKDVEGPKLRALKTEATDIRKELQKEIDNQTKAMKDGLARLLDTRVTAYATQAGNLDASATLQAMLTPMTGEKPTNPLARCGMNTPSTSRASLRTSTKARRPRSRRHLPRPRRTSTAGSMTRTCTRETRLKTSRSMNGGRSMRAVLARKNTTEAIKLETEARKKALESHMQADLKAQSNALRAQAGTPMLGEDLAKGYTPAKSDERWMWIIPKNWTMIEYIDWSTRWFLLVVGCLLMVGLFTRLSCFSAVIFLLLTILTQPSLPWIPAAPNNEGNYLVINKNVIEMVALLALMCTRSGRWFGLDALVHWAFGRRNKNAAF